MTIWKTRGIFWDLDKIHKNSYKQSDMEPTTQSRRVHALLPDEQSTEIHEWSEPTQYRAEFWPKYLDS